jgi:hypothetical protein
LSAPIQFGGKHIYDIHLRQSEQFAELDKAQSHRAGTEYHHLLSRFEAEVFEGTDYFAPGAGNYRFFRLYIGGYGILYLETVPTTLLRCGQAFFLQYLEVVYDDVFAEAAPGTVQPRCCKGGIQSADGSVAHLEVAYFGSYFDYYTDVLVSQSHRELVCTGEMSGYQFAVGGIAQGYHFRFYQGLVRRDNGYIYFPDLYYAGSCCDYAFHLSFHIQFL